MNIENENINKKLSRLLDLISEEPKMTVKKLIEQFKKYDGDLEVKILTDHLMHEPLIICELESEDDNNNFVSLG